MCQQRICSLPIIVVALTGFCLSSSAAIVDDRPPDDRITEAVERELRNDYRLRGADIRVRTNAGGVTLEGSVGSYLDKLRAERVCETIDGIRSVANRIKVEPSEGSDDAIADGVTERWENDSLLRSQRLKADVSERVVTITGRVQSHLQQIHAERLAREVRGVLFVRNQLQLGPSAADAAESTPVSPDKIRGRVVEALDRDAVLFRMPIDVLVDGGVVTLAGGVDNLQQRNLATRRVGSVPGVRQVNNQLAVGGIAADVVRSIGPGFDPAERVANDVRVELETDPAVDQTKVAVTSSRGIVVLRGSVPSMYQNARATRIARRIAGVRRVDNELVVDDDPRDDGEIQRAVTGILESDVAIVDDVIAVRVNKSVVTLSGTVDNIAEKRRATRLASRIRGVLSVSNDIDVEVRRPVDDAEVREQIFARLRADATTRRIAERIKITVTRGNARLEGIVDDWLQRRRTIQIVESTDGVQSMKPGLKVVDRPLSPPEAPK